MYVYVCTIQYNTVLPSTPSIIGCSYISRLPNKFSGCCLHPWKMLPASLEAADACPSGHNVQGFCPERESNINRHNLSSQDDNVPHSPYVIHRVPVFFGNDVVTDLVIYNESASSSELMAVSGAYSTGREKLVDLWLSETGPVLPPDA